MKTTSSKKQGIAIAAIAGVGILLAAIILLPKTPASDAPQGTPATHAEGDAGAERQAHPEGHDADHAESESEGKGATVQEKIAITDAQMKASGIAVGTAAAAEIATSITLPGEIHFNEDKTAHVVPRLAGVVRSADVDLGQKVSKGQVLATVASSSLSELRSELLSARRRLTLAKTTFTREEKLWQEKISAEQDYLQAQQAVSESEIALQNAQQKLAALGASAIGRGALNSYDIRAPFDGIVMEKHISPGEAVKEDANVFTIADLSTVWAEVAVSPKDLNVLRVGEPVTVKAVSLDATATGKIIYVGSLLGVQTRTAKARVVLSNPALAWRPGLFVNVDIVSGKNTVPVAVAADAVQTVDDKPTVFLRAPGGFVAQPVVLGRSDGRLVEVIKGLGVGSQYAAKGSFILKAELGKDSAEHAH